WVRFAAVAERLGKLEEGRDALLQAIQLAPRFDIALAKLAIIERNLGDYEEAERHARAAIDIHPSRWRFTLLGVILNRLGREEEAEASYRRAISLDPQWDEAYYNLGVLLRRRDPTQAEALFRKAIELDPNVGAPHRELGWVLCRNHKQLDQAE